MKWPSASEIIFSLKSFTSAMLALYIGMSMDLPRPFWAVLTAYVVANPLSGAVRSKALYRAGGTILGSAMAFTIVSALANTPVFAALAMALWVGLCLYVSLQDRTPRAYFFMLAGYTAALIGFPSFNTPHQVFDVALARMEEITLGISCAALIHSLILPQSLGLVLLARLDQAFADTRHWIAGALGGATASTGTRDRRILAGDITELRLMASHLPFDTSHLRWATAAVGGLQDQLSMLIPLLSGIENRLQALRALHPGTASARWDALLAELTSWSQNATRDQAATQRLHANIDALGQPITPSANWAALLSVSLGMRLHALIDAVHACRAWRDDIKAGLLGYKPVQRAAPVSPRVLHKDTRLAAISALAAMFAILACCTFWFATDWPQGATAALMAAVFCSFFATMDDPVDGIKVFLTYTVVSIPFSALYLLVLLPAAQSFTILMLVMAPVFLIVGVIMARPDYMLRALAFLFGVAGTLALEDTHSADLGTFLNSILAQIVGILTAALVTALFRTVDGDWTARRVLRAGWAELSRIAQGVRAPSEAEMAVRMLDRMAILTPRLSKADREADWTAGSALRELRLGLNIAQLARLQRSADSNALAPLLRQLAQHFQQHQANQAAAPALLLTLDAALQAACASAPGFDARHAIAALVGVRRDLFADAPDYQAAPEKP